MSKRFSQVDADRLAVYWLDLLRFKNLVGILLLVVGGALSFALANAPLVGGIVVPCFWVSGSYIILNFNLTRKLPTPKELEEEKWQELLRGGCNGSI